MTAVNDHRRPIIQAVSIVCDKIRLINCYFL